MSFWGAAIAGLLSFLSPCILPIVPFYLSYMAGQGMAELQAGKADTGQIRRAAVIKAVAFSAGILVIFIALGATATAFGQLVRDYMHVLRWAAAIVIALMGLHFLGVLRIGLLYRQMRAEVGQTSNLSVIGAFVIGMAFAFGWTPCVGPVLAAILFTAAGEESVGQGMALLATYGLGMTLPFILAAFFIGPFLRWAQGFRKHLPLIEKIMGVLLIIFAILIGTNSVNYIAEWMLSVAPDIGTIQ
ncbi:cytochrome c biogenesis CcdA family protein [Aliiroseovarius sp. PTFE2010]|uniref:cytochrome c biogenesis CcdA family protein n=1 Tax=Aliiroseovarius sp. PTFE2010 TaxID=3417190 RepID=UPI003CF241F6